MVAQIRKKWHSLKIDDVLSSLKTSEEGLKDYEAKERLVNYGANVFVKKKEISPLKIFVNQFKSFLIWILLFAAGISAVLGHMIDTVVISVIVILNSILGFIQEYRAEKAVEALEKMSAPRATVIRDGKKMKISAHKLVPGDIILLEVGDRVPADARLLEAVNLAADESALTGESVSVTKLVKVLKEEVVLSDRKNMIFAGTIITYGHGMAVVTNTGMKTEMGQIARMLETTPDKKTPLQKKMEQVARVLGLVVIGITAIIFGLGVIRGQDFFDMFLTSISLAVAAVPEGLPAIVTITLAIGLERMAKNNAIVRKLPVVETLGSATVICSDKTGTLTRNEMTVRQMFIDNKLISVTGEGYKPEGKFLHKGTVFVPERNIHSLHMLKVGALCNSASLYSEEGEWKITGDPTEAALIVAAAKAGFARASLLEQHPQVGEISFDSKRKRMTTIHRTNKGKHIACMKGAPEIVLDLCSHIYRDGRMWRLKKAEKEQILKIIDAMGAKALRVLGMAFKYVSDKKSGKYKSEEVEKDMVFLGLMGMIDPPRQEAKEAIKTCEKAGIKVVMITGDNKITAKAIATELNILKPGKLVLTGQDIEEYDDIKFDKIVERVAVYARVSPEHKMKIIKALKTRKHVVAMTGDGVNDAPALKNADIGVAMGIAGTDVAKEAADMILEDDNFATIVKAVEEGRGIYDNIKKFIRFLLSSNIGELMTIFAASLIGLPLPLIAVQILWMNLLTDGLPAVALGVDPIEKNIMQRKPRKPEERVIDSNMIFRIALVGAIMMVGTLWLFNSELMAGASLSRARTIAFTGIVMFQIFNVFNSRSEKDSMISESLVSNKYLLLALVSSVGLQVLILYIGFFQVLFDTVAIGLMDWVKILVVSMSVIVIIELEKLYMRKQEAKGKAVS